MMPGCFLARCPSIQAATRSSHGRRSASVSGIPACILAMFDSGWSRIALLERPAEPRREFFGDRRFAGPGHAHDHQDRRTAAMGACAVEAVDARCIGHKDRIGAADEKPAFHHADDSPDALLQSRRIGDAAEIAVENAVAAVGDKGRARRHAHARALAPSTSSDSRVASSPKATTSTGTGVCVPSRSTSLLPSTTMASRWLAAATIFSRNKRSTQSFDQIERAALDFVGAVDREIDLPMFAE